jgi:hypothetical protein
MAEDSRGPTEKPEESRIRQSLKIAGLVVGIVVPLATLVWIFYSSLYNRNVLCSVDVDACRTQVANLEATLASTPTRITVFQTVEVTVVHTALVTVTPEPGTTATPTDVAYESTGNCNAAFSNTPCTYVLSQGDRWEQIAQNSPYGDNCRYPEIMNVNRREDGSYPRLSGYDSDVGRPITVMPAAPTGSYLPRIRDALGQFHFINACNGNGFPCIFTVTESLPLFSYEQISQVVYRNNIFGWAIAGANLASDCSGRGLSIELGTRLVIPKRPLYTPTPVNGGG